MNRAEIERLARAGNALRPDWPYTSLVTFLTKNAGDRPLWDATRALMWIATEPGAEPGVYTNETPRLFTEDGPWWAHQVVISKDAPTPVPIGWCSLHRCEDSTARPCPHCRADRAQAITDPSQITSRIAAIRAQIRPATNPLQPPEPTSQEVHDADA